MQLPWIYIYIYNKSECFTIVQLHRRLRSQSKMHQRNNVSLRSVQCVGYAWQNSFQLGDKSSEPLSTPPNQGIVVYNFIVADVEVNV